MTNSKFLIRLKIIYEILKKTSCDIIKLQGLLLNNNIDVNKRQIYRDIKSVEQFFLGENEKMEEAEINEKKRAWKINNTTENKNISIDELYAKMIYFNNIPAYINDENKKRIQNEILKDLNFKNNHIFFKSIEAIQSFLKTDFFEKHFCAETEKKFKDIFWCLINQRKILIKNLPFKTYCQDIEKPEFSFSPVTFIIHQGSIFIAGTSKNYKVYVFDIAELKDYDYLNSAYKKREFLLSRIEKEMKDRFGICENYDDNSYDIILEINKEAGDYFKRYNWHHTQKFKVNTQGYFLNLKCGINKELLSWVFMMNSNVKIIKPDKLTQLYCRHLKDIQNLHFK